jgi:hypothetical protein
MTADQPLGMLTTYELRDRRRELQAALHGSTVDDRKRAKLREQLTAVITEQEERARSQARGHDARSGVQR